MELPAAITNSEFPTFGTFPFYLYHSPERKGLGQPMLGALSRLRRSSAAISGLPHSSQRGRTGYLFRSESLVKWWNFGKRVALIAEQRLFQSGEHPKRIRTRDPYMEVDKNRQTS